MTMTSPYPSARRRAKDVTFDADINVATATVTARGGLDLCSVDVLQGAVDVLIAAGRSDITLDFADISSLDRAAAWCVADIACALATRHGRLTITHTRDTVRAALGELCRDPSTRPRSTAMTEPQNSRLSEDDSADPAAAPTSPAPIDVMGGPDQPADTEDVMGGENLPPAGEDVMAAHGGDRLDDRDDDRDDAQSPD